MKLALTILLCLHGIIHVMGFLKSFNIAKIEELKLPIAKIWGIIWLLTCILFLTSAFVIYIEHSLGLTISISAIIISQILAFKFWSDAKFSTLANLIIVGLICTIHLV